MAAMDAMVMRTQNTLTNLWCSFLTMNDQPWRLVLSQNSLNIPVDVTKKLAISSVMLIGSVCKSLPKSNIDLHASLGKQGRINMPNLGLLCAFMVI